MSWRLLPPYARRGAAALGSALLLVLLASLPFAGCRAEKRPHVVIVTLDTTRADHFGFAGDAAARTPNFDALAAESYVFRAALAPSPMTLPAHATLLSGLYPIRHGIYTNEGFRLAEDVVTLPEILGERGWDTAAFVSSFPLDSQFRLDQGFSVYDDDFDRADEPWHVGFAERRAEETNAAVRRYLGERRSAKPLFLWVHYFDAHAPYEPPAPYDSLFAGSLYDGEIAYLDEKLGELRQLLDERLGEKTILAVVADHGESLGEHGEETHSAFVYDATLKVPFLLRLPAGLGKTVEQQVRTVDILPTLLAELGLAPPAETQGRDLGPLLRGEALDPDGGDAYLESRFGPTVGWAPLRALRTDRYKYILAPKRELYDLAADPGEKLNLAATEPARAAELEERLLRLERRLKAPALERSAASLAGDREALRKLAALGYVGARMPVERFALPSPRALEAMGNPRDKVEILYWRNAVYAMMESGRPQDARIAAERMAQLDPDDPSLASLQAIVLAAAGADAAAATLLEKVVRRIPEDAEAHLVLGRLLRRRGELERARRELEAAAELEPRAERLFELATLLLEMKDEEGFGKVFARARELDPSSTDLELFAARRALAAGRLEEAARSFGRVLARLPSSRPALAGRAEIARLAGDAAAEEAALRDLLRAVPAEAAARLRFAELLEKSDPVLAREHLRLVEDTAADGQLRQEAARRRGAAAP